MKEERFSYFLPPISNTIPQRDLTLREVWEYISGRKVLDVYRVNREGGYTSIGTLQGVSREVRSLSPEDYSSKTRGKVSYLPLCTFGGCFSKRSGDSLQETSGLVCLDIDHIAKLEGLSLEDLKDRLSRDREIGLRLLFTSPSGDGLKIVCKTSGDVTDAESYRREFETLNTFVSRKYSIPIGEIGLDKGISDITRGCLLISDPSAILREWEDVFHSEEHPLPKPEKKVSQRPSGGEYVSSQDWDYYIEKRLIPAMYERIDEIFPDMDFRRTGKAWESPYKLDGTPAKEHRTDKSRITASVPGSIIEQGGGAIGVIEYYSQRNSLSFGEARRELSRICGLEEEDLELSRSFAKQMNEQETYMDTRNTSTGGGQTPVPAQRNTPLQRHTEETQEEREERYRRDFLTTPDLPEIFKRKREGIKTGYVFKDGDGKDEALILPSGALTLVCGRSSHGKTRLLQNLALQIAEGKYSLEGEGESPQERDGVSLYFSFEEGLQEVIERVSNIKVNIPELSQYRTSNSDVLRDYFLTGELHKAQSEKRKEALPRLSDFVRLYKEGKLRLYYKPELYSGDLCNLLSFLSSQMKVRAVFIDYLQAMSKENYKKERREELREICKELTKTAIELNIPIVLSAQLNREAKNPSDMSGDNIAESADITRYANTIILLWDSSKSRDIGGGASFYSNTEDGRKLAEKGFILGERGKIYAVISKNRGGTPEIDAVLDYVPETGKILDNEDLPEGNPYPSGNLINL